MSNDILAKYSIIEANSRGRQYHEKYDDALYRSTFGRDRDRVIGSSAFRRLQYKTQVFVNYHGDHYRTRLTHSLEVAQISRWIAGGLLVNKDLAEIVALTHDLGHPPFGHAGEDALDLEMKDFAAKNNCGKLGFSHNAQSLKLITKIEHRFIEFQGLNLSWETLEGTAKHNGAIDVLNPKTHQFIVDFNNEFDLDLARSSSLEAQISAIADDIAYNNHDVEDGLRARLFDYEELLDLPIIGEIYSDILQKYPKVSRELLVGEARKRLILAMAVDVIQNTQRKLFDLKIKDEEDIRNCKVNLASFSDEMELAHRALKDFLMKNMYRHNEVNNMTKRASRVISNLFRTFIDNPKLLPEKFHDKIDSSRDLAMIVCDYVAGMTDRFAIKLNHKFQGK
jgi:dGTPase